MTCGWVPHVDGVKQANGRRKAATDLVDREKCSPAPASHIVPCSRLESLSGLARAGELPDQLRDF